MSAAQPGLAARPGPRIPSLDGLRAISIALVLVSHAAGTQGFLSQASIRPLGDLGELGVRVFFVISGYLITTLLLHEEDKTGRISLRAFYLRRTLRIFPAAYAFILAAFIATKLDWIRLTGTDFFHAITYTVNYYPERSWSIGHLWSLSGEEQFYLIWPGVIWKFGRRRAMRTAVAVCLLCPVIRLAFWYLLPSWHSMISITFVTTADAIAIGCVLTGAQKWLERNPFYTAIQTSRWFVLVPVGVFAVNAYASRSARLEFAVGSTMLNVLIALCIHYSIRFPFRFVPRILNIRFLGWIGVLSYSLYLWQQMFLNRSAQSAWTAFPLNLACLMLAAMASYYLIEHPFLELRKRLERRVSL